jgi:hypothetical protein
MTKELKRNCKICPITTLGQDEYIDCLEEQYEELEKENERLQQQIEKMKCCYLCKSVYNCAFADVFNFHCCDKWKLAKLQKRKL